MATNFKISIHRNSENVHLKLIGDFDGISAHELLDVLKRNCNQISRVFIHTNCLRNIHPFGINVFQDNLNTLKIQSWNLVFTGENREKIAPQGSQFL